MYIKYPKIRYIGDEENKGIFENKVVVQSKIDGANFMFWIDDNGLLHFGKRSSELSYGEYIARKGNKDWVWKAVPSIQEIHEKYPERFKKTLLYYGESMQQHTIHYDNISGFVGFDVFSIETMEFLDWKTAKKEFEFLGLPFINVHFEKHGSEIDVKSLKSLITNSPYREDGDEGIVIKCYESKNVFGRPLFAKIVDDSFKEKNKQSFSGIKNVSTDEVEIANLYCTDSRIEKIIYKLNDDGFKIEMQLMKLLFKEVVKDIFEENILEIYNNQKQIEFRMLNKIVANRCQKVLKNIMLKNI